MEAEDSLRVRRAIGYTYQSYQRAKADIAGRLDRDVRHPEWTGRLLDLFGRPDDKAVNIMVAGSKGKGSHAILTAAILQAAGVRTGLFTGPHHVDFMERFRIDGAVIPEDQFCSYMEEVHAASESLPVPPGQYIGPVGLLAVVAARWFSDESVEVGVYECGRGAKHDDVNQVRHRGAILTPVFLEHTAQLGSTLAEIADEKAAVAGPLTEWLVSGVQGADVESVLRSISTQRLYPYRLKDIVREPGAMNWVRAAFVHEERGEQIDLLLPDTSKLLWQNAASALAAVRAVWADIRADIPFPEALDLRRVRLPGRMDVLGTTPLVVLDGAIHRSGAVEIVRYANQAKSDGRIADIHLVASLPSDKDCDGVLSVLSELSERLILTTATNPNLIYDERLAVLARQYFSDVDWIPEVETAVLAARRRADRRDAIVFAGTQSFVGDILRLHGEFSCSIWREECDL